MVSRCASENAASVLFAARGAPRTGWRDCSMLERPGLHSKSSCMLSDTILEARSGPGLSAYVFAKSVRAAERQPHTTQREFTIVTPKAQELSLELVLSCRISRDPASGLFCRRGGSSVKLA